MYYLSWMNVTKNKKNLRDLNVFLLDFIKRINNYKEINKETIIFSWE